MGMIQINKPRVLLACMYQDFGQQEMLPDFSNASWEYFNIYKSWKQLEEEGAVDIVGVHWLNVDNNPKGFDRLLSLAREANIIFQVAVNHGLSICKPYCDKIIEAGIPIVDYPPDIWARFDHHTPENWIVGRYRENYVTHFLSPAQHVLPLMRQHNLPVKYMPFGIDDGCDRILDAEKKYDVSFVGQKHGIRGQVIDACLKAGIEIHLFGHYWDGYPNWYGRPCNQEMNEIFNSSHINLNLRWTSRSPSRGLVNGRSFELLGAGTFMLATQHVETDDFHELYTPGNEFVEYHYVNEMIEAIKYYLDHDEERQAIADAAYLKRQDNLWITRLKGFLVSKFWEQ
jgi:spore maturation protein CgeB